VTTKTAGFGCIGRAGPMIYMQVMLLGEHWTRLLSGFASKKQAREYIEQNYPGVEILPVEEFSERSKAQMHGLGVRAGLLEPDKPVEAPLPEGDLASIYGQAHNYQLLLMRGTLVRAISGLATEAETEEMWEGLYKTYQLVSHDVFEKVKKKRGIV